jgi:hypothetical protein
MDITTIRYSAPKNGVSYTTETLNNTSTQSAMNIIKSRIPDARVSWVRFETVPSLSPSERRNSGHR